MKFLRMFLNFIVLFCFLASSLTTGISGSNNKVKKFEILSDYYTWYGDAWVVPDYLDGEILYPFTDPLRGHYHSADPVVAAAQNEEKNYYGVGVDIISWWGQGAYSESYALAGYFNAYNFSDRQFCMLYEAMGLLAMEENWDIDFNNPLNESLFLEHISYFEATYFTYPNYYRIDGKPVVYIWVGSFENFGEVSEKVRDRVYLIGTEPIFFPPSDNDFRRIEKLKWYDAITDYGICPTYLAGKYGSLTVEAIEEYVRAVVKWDQILKLYAPDTELILPIMFAYHDGRGEVDKEGNNRVLTSTPEQAEMFAKAVRFLADTLGIDKIHLTSYNEHWEGHGAEPSKEYGDLWLRLIKKYFVDESSDSVESIEDEIFLKLIKIIKQHRIK